ncbi:MAG: peptidoglycan-binding protein [Burkholderiales bacterium]|nr:peptidoglycan-binding protein [Burkholderiales bacterium]
MKLRSLILASSLAALAGGLQVASAQNQPPTPSYERSPGTATSPGTIRGDNAASPGSGSSGESGAMNGKSSGSQPQDSNASTDKSMGSTAAPKASAGQSSDTVRQAQEALEAKGHDVGTADGVMGPKTRTALLEYQKQQNIPQTGRLDQATLAALGVSGSSTPGASGSPRRSNGSD